MRITNLAVFVAPIAALCGCSNTTTATLEFENYLRMPVAAKIEVTEEEGSIYKQELVKLPAAPSTDEGQPPQKSEGTLTMDVPLDGKIKVAYSPGGSNAQFTLPTEVVPTTDTNPKYGFSVSNQDTFNTELSISQLVSWAKSVSAEGENASNDRLVDVLAAMGQLIFRKEGSDGLDVQPPVTISPPPKLRPGPATTLSQSAHVNRAVVSKASVSVPMYGSVAAQIDESALYKMTAKLTHFRATNTVDLMERLHAIKTAVNGPDVVLRDQILVFLDDPSTRDVLFLQAIHLIDSGVVSLTKARTFSGTASADVFSVLSTEGAYVYDTANVDSFVIDDMVVRVEPLSLDLTTLRAALDVSVVEVPAISMLVKEEEPNFEPGAATMLWAHQVDIVVEFSELDYGGRDGGEAELDLIFSATLKNTELTTKTSEWNLRNYKGRPRMIPPSVGRLVFTNVDRRHYTRLSVAVSEKDGKGHIEERPGAQQFECAFSPPTPVLIDITEDKREWLGKTDKFEMKGVERPALGVGWKGVKYRVSINPSR